MRLRINFYHSPAQTPYIELSKLKFITSGQINIPTSIDTTGTPLPEYKTKPKIVRGYWSKDKDGINQIKEAYLEDTVYFVIETFGIEDNKTLSVQLYDYDHFLWHDLWNIDDKIDNPREVKVKNNQAVIEVYLKPDWKKHIDEEKGWLSTDDAIELYWEISCSNPKISEKIFPQEIYNYLKVRNNRDIYIKPVMSETGYSYGVPEMYSFEGEPMFFADISELIEIPDEKTNRQLDIVKDGAKAELQKTITNKIEAQVDKKLESFAKKQKSSSPILAIVKTEKPVRSQGKMPSYHQQLHDYGTPWQNKRIMSGRNISLSPESFSLQLQEKLSKGQKLDGIFKKSFYENKSIKAKGLYAVKNAAGMFDEFYDLVSFAKGGNIDDAQLAILGMLLGTNFLEDILMSLTLDVLQTPMREQIQDWQNQDVKRMNIKKNDELERLDRWIEDEKRITLFFSKNIFIEHISYEAMQGLLEGKIKNWEQLNKYYKRNEVAIFCIAKDGYSVIDSFFINL